jgi:hypothetical protein
MNPAQVNPGVLAGGSEVLDGFPREGIIPLG